MKRLLVFICTMFICLSSAMAASFTWIVDGETYDTTTCTVGDDLTVPDPAPTKYGYTFVGWRFDEIIGTGSQSGTPTPTNPIYPTFTPLGDTFLRAVDSGNNVVADSYDPIHNTITRRVGIKVLKGLENWQDYSSNSRVRAQLGLPPGPYLCSHLIYDGTVTTGNKIYTAASSNWTQVHTNPYMNAADWTTFLTEQYEAGMPVIIYYQLETPVEEQMQ